MGVGICLVNNPHSLQWSPFKENLLAVACSNRPGHTPVSGIIYFLEFLPKNQIEIETQVQLNIGCEHLAYSERDENVVMTSCDDNVLRLFDLKKIDCMFREYFETDKVRSLDWNGISLEHVLAGGVDNSVKVYDLLNEDTDEASHVYNDHSGEILDSQWSTHAPMSFMASDNSGYVYLWDMRESKKAPSMKFKMHNGTCAMRMDRNIYDEHSIALGGFDSSIYCYDLRNTEAPKSFIPAAHFSQITSLKFSPHTQHLIASGSTDRTLRIWDLRPNPQEEKPTNVDVEEDVLETGYGARVSSFKSQKMEDWVNDLDWNYHEVGLIAFCCNDQLTKAYNIRED